MTCYYGGVAETANLAVTYRLKAGSIVSNPGRESHDASTESHTFVGGQAFAALSPRQKIGMARGWRKPRCRKCGSNDVGLAEEIGANASFWDVRIDPHDGSVVTLDEGTSDGQPRYIRSYLACVCGHRWRTSRSVSNL